MAFADAQVGAELFEVYGECRVTLAGSCSRGDVLGYSSGWLRAIATTGGVVQGRLIAGAAGVSGQEVQAYRGALVGGRFSGATPGDPVYVARGSGHDGQVTTTAPNTSGDANTIVGRAISATLLYLAPDTHADSTAS